MRQDMLYNRLLSFCLSALVVITISRFAFAGGSLNKDALHTLLVAEKLLSQNPQAKEIFREKAMQLTSIDQDTLDLFREESARCMGVEYFKRSMPETYVGSFIKIADKDIDGDVYYKFHCPKNVYRKLPDQVVFDAAFKEGNKEVTPFNPKFTEPLTFSCSAKGSR